MGLAVAHALATRGDWSLHLLDLNATAGSSAVSSLGKNAHFHPCDVTSYASVSTVFSSIFKQYQRLDFVFANAGIAEKGNFYVEHNTGSDPPPEPDLLCLHISLDAVITTSYLAQHYFRQSSTVAQGEKNLVMTASCGGLYPSYYSPTYSAAKHGVVGFMRSIAKTFWKDGIRVNAICPGTVKTNLLTSKEWENFPEEYFTPVEAIVKVVVFLVDGVDVEKAEKGGLLWGKAVEISGTRHYYREVPDFCDEGMRRVMQATDIEELEH
jgi:NAD(P)-dependent dehydrogenase (short-subunit alcohol dehydrogenase family)